MKKWAIAAFLILPKAASAHPGQHEGMSLDSFLGHLLEWDHLGMIAVAGVAAWLVVRRLRASRHDREV